MTFIVVSIIIGLIVGFVSRSSPTIKVNNQNSTNRSEYSKLDNFNSIPNEIKYLIEQNKAFELAEVLVLIEKDGHRQNLESLLNAIEYKSRTLSNEVEKIRIDLRYRNHLDL